jgi:hypothetical protein
MPQKAEGFSTRPSAATPRAVGGFTRQAGEPPAVYQYVIEWRAPPDVHWLEVHPPEHRSGAVAGRRADAALMRGKRVPGGRCRRQLTA